MVRSERKRSVGFTLIELMVAVAVIAILAAIAVPAFGNLIDRSDLRTVSVSVHADLESTRLATVGAGAGSVAEVAITTSTTSPEDWSYVISGERTLSRASTDFPAGVKMAVTQFGGDSKIEVSQQYYLDGDSGVITLTSESGDYATAIHRTSVGIFVLCSNQSIMGYAACP